MWCLILVSLETNSETRHCLQNIYWGKLLGDTLVRKGGKQGEAES